MLDAFNNAGLRRANHLCPKFRLNEGQKALERSAAAKGGLYSGSTLKALSRYGQDYASNEYQNAYNRDLQNRQAKYNFLAGVSGAGQTATAQVGNLGAQNSAINAGLITSAGAARGAGIVGESNAYNRAIGQGVNAYNQYQTLKALQPQSTGNVIPDNSQYLP